MKYLFSVVVFAILTIGFSSCSKNAFCYECTHPTLCDVDICDGHAEMKGGMVCDVMPKRSGSTNEEFKNAYKAQGYTCKLK